jgi:hypothetical protein
MYQHLPLQDPPKFIRIWIFGLETCHLATLSFGTLRNNRFCRHFLSQKCRRHWLGFPAEEIESDFLDFQNNRLLVLLGK